MTSLEGLILTGVCQLLDAAGVGSWSPTAVPTIAPAIYRGPLQPTPDKAIGVADYPVINDPQLADCVIGVQVRARGTDAPDVARELDAAVFDALTGVERQYIGTDGDPDDAVYVSQIVWQSGADIGPDSNGRYERVSNWYVYVARDHARLID